jgi:hypothetical protein
VEIQLSVEGVDPLEGMEDLAEWLGQEPELRGRVKPAPAAPAPGELGGVTEVLIAVLGTSGAAKALASSLSTYLTQPRRRAISIKAKGPKGRSVELDAQNAEDAVRILQILVDREGQE